MQYGDNITQQQRNDSAKKCRKKCKKNTEGKDGFDNDDVGTPVVYGKVQTERPGKDNGSKCYAETGDKVIPGHTPEDADNGQQRQTDGQKQD